MMKKFLFILAYLPLVGFAQQFDGNSTFVSSDDTAIDNVKFVTNYSDIKSFDDVLKQFEGRTVYIDLWATWCGPCVAEFKHKDGLNTFTAEHDIDVLYISVDKDGDDAKWKTFIEENALTGYHMRASQELGDHIRKLFSQEFNGRTAFGIPYYIIAKDGQIALKNAPRPSAKGRLYDELKKHK